ncbi:MAG: DUF1800 family protein [Candidatus Eremiobacteraeota bacterium]|nr:DUF1800 family protein [Candidatus Eremiobacteraeota bacterium]
MMRVYAFAAFACLMATTPVCASPSTFATTFVSAATPPRGYGYDAGVDLAGGRYVRITASGTIELRGFGPCGRDVGPNGCAQAFSLTKQAQTAPGDALVAAFVGPTGAPVSAWVAVGEAAYVAIPNGAARVIFRVNGATGYETGAFRVVTDVVDGVASQQGSPMAQPSQVARAPASGSLGTSGLRRTLPTMRSLPGTLLQRNDVQYLLRRFGFSDTPAAVTAVYRSGGVNAWLAQQLAPANIDDSALAAYLEPVPFFGSTPPAYYDTTDNILQRRILQREIASKRQLLEKMTLHWLEHFAVSEDKVASSAAMIQYEETVRTDALGNFAQLVSDVAVTPAMLLWLDNNNNDGSNVQKYPPNENFGRELMQLYVLGTTQLNPDGSQIVDGSGNALQTYTDADVKQAAQALTGFQRVEPPNPGPTADPRTLDTTRFFPTRHAKGPFTVMGQTITDTGDQTIVNKVVASLVGNPTTAPFEVKELLQRFVTETPSPGYISRIVAVWNANASAPDQLAKVMAAVAADPEFYSGKGAVVKEPIEYGVDAIRALNGAAATPYTTTMQKPYGTLYNVLGAMQEQHWYPPSVFSFYRPGDKESLLTNSLLLTRWNDAVSLGNAARTSTLCAKCDQNLDLTNLAALAGSGTDPGAITGYLLDALADGGSPALQALLTNYLANGTTKIPGAVWIVLTSPEYEVD